LAPKPVVFLAADHRYFGVVAGLEKPNEVLTPLLMHVDVLMTDPGVMRNSFGSKLDIPVMMRASGCTSTMDVTVPGYLQEPAKAAYKARTGRDFDKTYQEAKAKVDSGAASPDDFEEFRYLDGFLHEPDTIANEKLILDVEGVREAGGEGAAVSVYLRTRYQSSTLDNLATMSRQARKVGMPVLGVVAVGDALGYLEKDSDFLTRAGAIMVAHGADIIKTYNCGQGFERVIESTGVPVIVAGGKAPKNADPADDSLRLAHDSIQKGAMGIDFGRRVWRDKHPVAMVQALRAVVCEGEKPEQALQLYKTIAREGARVTVQG
jgi:DhnA family fructose-bisphosphate aldolase class Ia